MADAGIAVAADEPSANEKPASGDTFVQATIGDYHRAHSEHHLGRALACSVRPDLRRPGADDKDLNWIPSMAESWQFSKDCLSLTFKLRKDVKWHDGKPFTAEDVHFTYKTMMNPKTPTAYRDDFELVREVQVLDPYTVRIIYSQPYAKALGSWGTAMLPKHLLAKYVEEGKLREAPQNTTSPIGTGPYKFQEWKSGEKVVLVANKDYYVQSRPYLGRVVYRIIPSQATIFLELKAKGVDMADLTAIQYARQTDYAAFKQDYNKYRYYRQPLHVFRLQPEGSALRGQAGETGVRLCHQQARADRRRGHGAGSRGDGAVSPRNLGLHGQGEALSV
jgi:peptide/nickel transport system substrate-binding protein